MISFREMNALYVIACLLLGVSIAAELVAKRWHAEAMQTVAKAATASPEVREEARQNADVFVVWGLSKYERSYRRWCWSPALGIVASQRQKVDAGAARRTRGGRAMMWLLMV